MMPLDELLQRNNVKITGNGNHTLLLAHGFGCDQNMWRFVTPSLLRDYRIVLFDYVGSGRSELAAYDNERYSQLGGYAQDIFEICDALDLEGATLIGHSGSSMTGLIASIAEPGFLTAWSWSAPRHAFSTSRELSPQAGCSNRLREYSGHGQYRSCDKMGRC